MASYKGISFSSELNCSLENFKKMFASNKFFLEIPHLERDAELKKVWKQVNKENGNAVPTISKSKKTKSAKVSETNIQDNKEGKEIHS